MSTLRAHPLAETTYLGKIMETAEQSITLNANLLKNYYLIVDPFISAHQTAQLAAQIRLEHTNTRLPADDQVVGSPAFSNLPFLRELHQEILEQVEQLAECALLSSYVYGRIYQQGAVLAPHRDRDACEVSVTLNVASSEPWGIWFEKPDGEKKQVILQPGAAAIYLGCDALHWREPFAGTECIQIFLHYVQKYGKRNAALA